MTDGKTYHFQMSFLLVFFFSTVTRTQTGRTSLQRYSQVISPSGTILPLESSTLPKDLRHNEFNSGSLTPPQSLLPFSHWIFFLVGYVFACVSSMSHTNPSVFIESRTPVSLLLSSFPRPSQVHFFQK